MRFKRFFSFLLTLAMVLTLMPMTVLGDGTVKPCARFDETTGVLTLYDEVTLDGLSGYKNNKKVKSVVAEKGAYLNNGAGVFSDIYAETMDLTNLDTSNVVDMSEMFSECANLTSLNIADWDTSKVENMAYMFEKCNKLQSLDLSGWNTSNVKNMSEMFACGVMEDTIYYDVLISDLTSIKFGKNWNTSKVENMSRMFAGCSNLPSVDLSGFDTSSVRDMSFMFGCCISLTSIDLSKFDTSDVRNMEGMFFECAGLTSIDVSGFDTSEVTSMMAMFFSGVNRVKDNEVVSALTSIKFGDKWNTSKVTDMMGMFGACINLKTIDLSKFDTSNVTDMEAMFAECSSLTSLDLSSFDTANLALIDWNWGPLEMMFYDCGSLTTIYAGDSWKLSDEIVDNSCDVFIGCVNLVGGAGTAYADTQDKCEEKNNSIYDAFLARIDEGASNPGYFTDVANKPTPSSNPTPSTNPTPSSNPTPSTDPTPSTNPTPSINPIPTSDPELSVGDFINRCYNVALGRDADEAGYNYWVDSLTNGQACGSQVGYGFIFSEEYINKNRTNEEFVKDMYAMYFGREADEAGFNYWVDMLEGGASREDIMAGFANSEEFFNLCARYGVVCGTYMVNVPNEQQGGVNCFVARLYKVCLNRLPDMGGQAGWVMKLMNGEVTGSTCAYGFVFSPEFINMNLDNTNYVKYMYNAFFGREADEAGLAYWADMLNAGTATREDVFAGFTGSAEFANLCAGYGINP